MAGTISGEQNGGLLLQSSSEYREVAAAGPYGVKSLPPAGENAVGVVSGEKTFCLGVEIDPKGLQPGELVLFSSGGAKITLTRMGKSSWRARCLLTAQNNKEAVMDTAIKDRDFQTNGSGLPVRISGVRELLQRAVFRLTVKREASFMTSSWEAGCIP